MKLICKKLNADLRRVLRRFPDISLWKSGHTDGRRYYDGNQNHLRKFALDLRPSAFTFFTIFILLISLSSCANLEHLSEMQTLQDLSGEQEAQKRYVEEQDEKFEHLLSKLKTQKMDRYRNKREVVRAFGDAVIEDQVARNGETIDRWFYRYATRQFTSDKVYLYFNARDELIAWEYYPIKQEETQDTRHMTQE